MKNRGRFPGLTREESSRIIGRERVASLAGRVHRSQMGYRSETEVISDEYAIVRLVDAVEAGDEVRMFHGRAERGDAVALSMVDFQ